MSGFKFIDHGDAGKKYIEEQIHAALYAVGEFVQQEASYELENDPRRIRWGRLRGSIDFAVTEMEGKDYVVIGTNTEYAIYVHEGTGKYHPNGRQIPWVYKSEYDGKFYRTSGMRPNRFLKNAVLKNKSQITRYLKENIHKK